MVDRGFQLAYICAYQVMRRYWSFFRVSTHGALVTVWNRGEVLLVRNSYVSFYSLPGGYLRAGETARDAALRELFEEVQVRAKAEDLVPLIDETHDWEGKRDHVEIFSIDVAERPTVKVDHREVVEASWWSPERALSLNLFPPLRRAIERRRGSS